MKIIIDPNAGPCGGVKRAIRMVERRLQDHKDIVSIGPLIHNNAEVARLKNKGLETIKQDQVEGGDASVIEGKRVFIRSHGVSEKLMQTLQDSAVQVFDGTCPKVAAIQKLIRREHEAGRQIVIIGKPGHPEVVGLNGHCDNRGVVVASEKDFDKIDFSRPIFLVSQTTISHRKFIDLMEKMLQITPDILVKDTVCRQVMNKHEDLRKFAASVDVLLLVGGRQSSNTAVLFELAKSVNPSSYWIEGEKDVDLKWLDNAETVGVSGSASTPMWQMEKIRDYLQNVLLPVQD